MRDRTHLSRRAVLGGAAGLLASTATLPGVVAANSPDDLPVAVTGTRVAEVRPTGDRVAVDERFVSPDLEPRYGRRTVELGTEALPREALPDRYASATGAFTLSAADTAVIGTFAEHRRAEQRLRDSAGDDVSADATYSGPLYVYKTGASNPDPGDFGERTGPINVGWSENLGMDASDVSSHMHSNGWETPWLGTAGTRWIIVGGDAEKQDTHIGKNYGAIWTPDQWHVRAYDLPDWVTDDLAVVGQVHRDPQDHGQLPGDTDWSFAASRQEVTGDWSGWGNDTGAEYVGNGGRFDSAYGYLGRVNP